AFATTLLIRSNGIESLKSPRNSRTSLSRRALPGLVLPPSRAVHTASAPMSSPGPLFRQRHHLAPLRFGHPLDSVSYRRPGNDRSVLSQVRLEPGSVGLARLAQHPADRLLDQIFAV